MAKQRLSGQLDFLIDIMVVFTWFHKFIFPSYIFVVILYVVACNNKNVCMNGNAPAITNDVVLIDKLYYILSAILIKRYLLQSSILGNNAVKQIWCSLVQYDPCNRSDPNERLYYVLDYVLTLFIQLKHSDQLSCVEINSDNSTGCKN